MKTPLLFCSLLLVFHLAMGQSKKSIKPVTIKWASTVGGNFSFTKKWSYPEGIEHNEYGQLSCNGFCPPEVAAMTDSTGKIYKDSLAAYYSLVDTTHQPYTIQCKAWCYEWAGTHFIEAVKPSADTVRCYTLLNAATHYSLQLTIVGNQCFAAIELNSIAKGGTITYPCTSGYITIDKNLWAKGIVKAIFNFNFEHKENPKQPIFWNGKIFTTLKKS